MKVEYYPMVHRQLGGAQLQSMFSADAMQRSEIVTGIDLRWRGTGTTFGIVPVLTGSETRDVVAPALDAMQHAADRQLFALGLSAILLN